MNVVYIVCVIAVLMHLIFLPPFLWAIKRRELRGSDDEAYHAVQEEPLPAPPPRRPLPEALVPYTRSRMILLFGFLITLFVLILASLVYVTVKSTPAGAGWE